MGAMGARATVHPSNVQKTQHRASQQRPLEHVFKMQRFHYNEVVFKCFVFHLHSHVDLVYCIAVRFKQCDGCLCALDVGLKRSRAFCSTCSASIAFACLGATAVAVECM